MESTFFFLFRSDQGVVGRGCWLKGVAGIVGPALALSAIWFALKPFAAPPTGAPAIRPMTIVAFLYLLIYAFAVILAAICYYNLSAKRFRARNRPAALAGLVPFGLLLTGAAFWLAPRSEGYFSPVIAYALAAASLLIAAWTFVDLGVLDDSRRKTS